MVVRLLEKKAFYDKDRLNPGRMSTKINDENPQKQDDYVNVPLLLN